MTAEHQSPFVIVLYGPTQEVENDEERPIHLESVLLGSNGDEGAALMATHLMPSIFKPAHINLNEVNRGLFWDFINKKMPRGSSDEVTRM